MTDVMDFQRLLTVVSNWYDQRGYLNMLKVLCRDLVVNIGKLCAASGTMDIMNMLYSSGNLFSTDLTVIYDTMKATNTFGLEKKIPSCPNVRGIKISKFTPLRQKVMKLGLALTDSDVVKISELYNKPVKEYEDSWSLIMDLEQRMIIDSGKLEDFIEKLNKHGLVRAEKALIEDISNASANPVLEFGEEIDDDILQQLLPVFSEWYDKQQCTSMLKVLYRDLIKNTLLLNKASRTNDLMDLLISSGNLHSTVLYATIKTTGTFGLETEIKKQIPSCPQLKDVRIFSLYRQKVMKLGMVLMHGDIVKICGLYDKLQGKTFPDNWSFIMELEHQMIICESEGRMVEFIDNLKQLGLPLAIKALTEEPTTYEIFQGTSTMELPRHQLVKHDDASNEGKSGKSKQPRKKRRLHKGIGKSSISKRQKLDKDKPLQSEQPKRSRADEGVIIKDYLMKRQKELYRNVNHMTPAIWHKGHKVDIAKVFTELKLLQSKEDDEEAQDKSTCTKKEGRPTSLPEALNVIKSTGSCKVLITGKGGMGKTTLLKYIAHQWATDDEHVFADKLLFLINIREIQGSKTFLNIIMNKIDVKKLILKNNLSWNSVERFLVIHDNEIIILLDGYDELETNAKDPLDLFKREELGESLVVITSRPDNTADLFKCCDVHIEVKGFSPSNIKKYIQNHFHSVGKTEIGGSLIKEFELDSDYTWYWGGNHEDAFELCSSPLLLLQICTIWELKSVLPTHLPDLFKEIICCIINQYLNRAGNKNAIASFERIPDQYLSAILILGECMYEGLKKNILSIDKYDLSKNTNNEDLLNLALEFGFVYEDTPANPGDIRVMYTPPHKLMSEALAGLYLSTEIQKGSSKVEYDEIRCNDYLNMTRVFAIGFLGADADKLFKPWIRASHYRSIAKCLEHVKKEHEDDILQKLDKHMPNDVKAYSEQMWESFRSCCLEYVKKVQDDIIADKKQMLKPFRSLLNDDLPCINLFKFLKMCWKGSINPYHLEKAVVSLINRCSERQCQLVVHTLMLLEVLEEDGTYYVEPTNLLQCISTWDKEEVNLLEAEMEKHDLKYYLTEIVINFEISSTFLIHLLKYASKVKVLIFSKLSCWLTGTILNEVINEMYNANRKLELKILDIEDKDLNDIDGMLLGKLFKIAPKLEFLDLANCRLSGGILRAMITECQNKIKKFDINNCSSSSGSINEKKEECGRMNTFLKGCRLRLKDNDLSDIDGKSLAELVRVICQQCHHEPNYDWYYFYDDYFDDYQDNTFRWSDCSLTVDNLEKLVESAGKNITLNWEWLDLSGINLSSMSGITLAHLFKVSPELNGIDMSNCILSGRIFYEMMEECCRMNVVLKDKRIFLEGTDLSDIDGKSLAALIVHSNIFEMDMGWSDYSLKANNLKMLVECVGELNWQFIDLSGINLSSMSGITLAHLLKVSPDLIEIDMSYCSISCSIVNEMMEECCRMNLVLKDCMLRLEGNDLSDIDSKSLAALIVHFNIFGEYMRWSDCSLKANNLKMLVEYVGENITLNWQFIDLSGINLSSVSGITLAQLFKVSPELKHINMSDCSLSGSIVNEMMEECCRMYVVLKDNILSLKGNDLSGIDDKSLAELVRVIQEGYNYGNQTFMWSNYSLTADNLKKLVESLREENITLNWQVIDLSMINLSSVSGKTLAYLVKISPDLIHIDMSYCSLSGRIVNEMMEECCRMNVVLKDNMFNLWCSHLRY